MNIKLTYEKNRQVKIACFFLVLAVLGIWFSLLWPRVQYQRGLTMLGVKDYDRAVVLFEKAAEGLPGVLQWLVPADLFRIQTNLGKSLYHKGIHQWRTGGRADLIFALMEQGKSSFVRAAAIEPVDYINTYWLARTEEALERLYPVFHPKEKNPYDALVFYESAMALRPSGISVKYLYARYLYQKGMREKIPGLVQSMVRVYPLAYKDLKKEVFFNTGIIPFVEQGLQEASGLMARDALKSLSMVYWDMGDFDRAIEMYRKVLVDPSRNTDNEYSYMGALLTAGGQTREGFETLEKVLGSKQISDDKINILYGFFEQAGLFEQFLDFSFYAKDKGLSSVGLDLCVAKCLIADQRLEFARARLIRINAVDEDPRAYLLLAQIAEQEMDWEVVADMARAVLGFDSVSARAYYLLSRAHEGMGQFSKAKESAVKALQLDPLNGQFKHQEAKFEKIR